MEIFVDTLLPSAIFSLVSYTGCVLFMPSIGKLVDKCNRFELMRWSLTVETIFIILSCGLLRGIMYLTNADGHHRPTWSIELYILFAMVVLCGAVGQIFNNAQTLSIERDWVVVLSTQIPKHKRNAEEASAALLTAFNTTMRRIDLSCKVLSPSVFGFIMEYAGNDTTQRATIGTAIIALWTLLSFPLILTMTYDLYCFVPSLQVKEHFPSSSPPTTSTTSRKVGHCSKHFSNFKKQWIKYSHHPVFYMSISFCLLYMTILSGGSLNIGYLKWRGVSDGILGMSGGAGAISGLIGTFFFAPVLKMVGSVEKVAVVSCWLFWCSLLPILLAFFVFGESRLSDGIMIGSIVLSRAFLWMCDLAETQVMQQWVKPQERGIINAMQKATSQFSFIVILLAGIAFSDPSDFFVLVNVSILAVFFASVGFTLWWFKLAQYHIK